MFKGDFMYIGTIILIIIDQLVKYLISNSLEIGDSINIIPNFFNISYIENTGAAWSILEGQRIFFIISSVVVLGFLYYFCINQKKLKKIEEIIYSLLFGGIIGNTIDRITRGAVIDYLDFNLFGYPFPIFNIADIAIVIGAILWMIHLWKEDKVCKK